MAQVFDPRTIRQHGPGHACVSQFNGSHWQLMHLNIDSQPIEVALQECLQRGLLQRSFFPRKHLASLILGVLSWSLMFAATEQSRFFDVPVSGALMVWRLFSGPCDLMAELQQLRRIMLMGSTHMRHWSKLLATELNVGLKLAKPDDAHILTLQRLEVQLQQILVDNGVMHSDEIVSRYALRGRTNSCGPQ